MYQDSYLNNYTPEQKANALKTELESNKPGQTATVSASGNKLSVTYRGKDKVLDISTGIVKEPSVVAKAIMNETVFNDDNTPMTDENGNTFIIPKGFKISKDSAEVVTEGIVIEDATYTNTIGSEFVWIPVSKDSTDANKVKGATKNTTILLGRYKFKTSGNDAGTIDVSKTDGSVISESIGGKLIFNYTEETPRDTGDKNAVAKNIEDFKTKTNVAGGFWIGRYEARTTSTTVRTSRNDTLTSITEKPENSVYNYIKQADASVKSRDMYSTNNYFESDLINSYAWDTATLFLQEYDNRIGSNLKKYSIQDSINTGSLPLTTGTVSEINKDKICNVYDMASNCFEWTTETCDDDLLGPCVLKGGGYTTSNNYTSSRASDNALAAYDGYSFRPILYVK